MYTMTTDTQNLRCGQSLDWVCGYDDKIIEGN